MGANPKDLFAAVGQLTADAMRPFPDSTIEQPQDRQAPA